MILRNKNGKIKWAMSDLENYVDWTDNNRIELRTNPIYDSCFLEAIEESDMTDCHKKQYINYINGKRNYISNSCCTIHSTMAFINKRARELYQEKINGN